MKRFPLRTLLLAATCGVSMMSAPGQTAAPGTAPLKPGAAAALAPAKFATYDNRFEIYGGLAFSNGQAGQNLPKRFNMGGGEVMATYWITNKIGAVADYRIGAGTTPVISPYYNRVVVTEQNFSGGVQYRGPKNRYAAIDFHALGGGTNGTFDHAINNYPGGSPVSSCPYNGKPGQLGTVGLYCNGTAGWGAVGGSVDFNYSKNLAIRLQPDLTFEHYGTELREFFAISAGVVYRIGKK